MAEFDPFQIHRPINVGITNRSSQMTLYMYQLMWTSRRHDIMTLDKQLGLTVHLKEKYNAGI